MFWHPTDLLMHRVLDVRRINNLAHGGVEHVPYTRCGLCLDMFLGSPNYEKAGFRGPGVMLTCMVCASERGPGDLGRYTEAYND